LRDEPINCSADSDYEFDPNTVPPRNCSADSTSGHDHDANIDPALATIEGGGRCRSQQAVVIRLSHYNDWGATCGFYDGWSPSARNEAAYDGLSFWARAAEGTGTGFTLSLEDANTTSTTKGGNCKEYNAADGGLGGSTINAATDPVTGQVISGSAIATRLPDECGNNKGNSYDYVMSVTHEWVFYTIPWGRFTQAAYPNRVPNSVLSAGTVPGTGLLTDKLFGVDIRPPKEARFELWIDQLTFYRKKRHDAGPDVAAAVPDAGLDAPAAGADAEPDAPAPGADAEPDVGAADADADVDAEPDAAQM
jgi:hypothetical protein